MEGIEGDRPPYRWAVATFLAVFGVYVLTLSPTAAFWDTAEYIAAAKTLGIPHPPGNPLFTLIAHVWGFLPLGADYAKRINFFAAATSATGAAFWFLIAERWLRSILPARGPRIAAAFAGIFASAMAWTVWNQSTVNEKVYTVSLMSIAMVIWCMVYWADQPKTPRRDRFVILAIYISMLSSTNHQMGILGLPVVGWYILSEDWSILLRWRIWLAGAASLYFVKTEIDALLQWQTLVAVAALGYTIVTDERLKQHWKVLAAVAVACVVGISLHYIYLPIRAGQFPPINEGEPVGFFSQALKDNLNRVQYAKPGLFPRQPWSEGMPEDNIGHFGAQLWNYWEYWTWQWGRDVGSGFQGAATGLFTALGLGGLLSLWKRERRAGVAALGLLVTLTLLLVFYLNFKFGYSYKPGDPNISLDMHEVRERDYFFLCSFAFVGVLFAAGFAAMIRGIGEWLGDRVPEQRRWVAGTPVLIFALVPLFGNHITAPRSGETLARDFAIDMLNSVEPYGILITAGDNDTFPLWYAQEVLGVRRDITLANLSLMNTEWHLRQIKRRVEPDFDAAIAHPFWQPNTDSATSPLGGAKIPQGGWVKPKTPVFEMSEAELTALPEVTGAPKDTMSFGGVTVKFGRSYAERADIATVLLIRDNIGKRPIYFSWSDADYPDERLGLTPFLVSQGLVRKLMPDSVKVGGNIVVQQYLNFVDIQRTKQLLFGVYHPEAAARARGKGWVDRPSLTILQLYLLTYLSGAALFEENGDSELARKASDIGGKINMSMPPRSIGGP